MNESSLCRRCNHPRHQGGCTKELGRGIRCACQAGWTPSVVVDYSALEARLGAALSDDDGGLEALMGPATGTGKSAAVRGDLLDEIIRTGRSTSGVTVSGRRVNVDAEVRRMTAENIASLSRRSNYRNESESKREPDGGKRR